MLKRLALAALVATAGLACASTVAGRSYPALDQRRAPILRIAVAPFAARPEGAADAAGLVARHLTEALVDRGVEVVGPEDVARALGATGPPGGAAALAALVKSQFDADTLVLGEITRWVEREGAAAGSRRPAAVGVRIELYDAPGGARLWEGEFDHTQQAMTENVLLTPRYPGRGARWLTAEEFAQFAASELAAALPLAP